MGTALMGPDADRVFVAIGILKSEVSNLAEKFDHLDERTTDEQRKVHDIVVATSEAVRNVVRTVDNLQRLVEEMKPLTDDYREKRAEARGAARLAGWLYTAAGVVGGFVVFLAGKVFEWISSRPHIPIIVILIALTVAAAGQHNHAQHHAHYKSWVNKDGKGCCNNDDCGSLKEADERSSGGTIEVRIDGQWCAVQSRHYLKTGNAPDWTTSHVCVDKYPKPGQSMCDRLLCYQPRPLF
jgi:hypothetical protein